MRSVQNEPSHSQSAESHRSAANTPTPWDNQTIASARPSERQHDEQMQGRSRNGSNASARYPPANQPRQRDSSHSRDRGSDRGGSISRAHGRSDSGATGLASSNDYATTHDGRRHDFDVQSMETSLSSPRGLLKSPIPAPTVTVRSEFPTLSRSRQQQSLTCLITVEVV